MVEVQFWSFLMEIQNSFELFVWLKKQNLLENSPQFWWPNYGTFEVVISAILTQNTKWQNVEKSLDNLRNYACNDLSLEFFSQVELGILNSLIAPSGFKNQKSPRIVKLCKNILDEFDTFENFKTNVSREWLLGQKGIGFESADSILCYACLRDEMVVDAYTARLLNQYGYEFESYEELKEWLIEGVNENFDKICAIYNQEISLNYVYSRFHGKIVEFSKRKSL